ncbi:MAG: SRPBCC family protein [Ferruginibacter sp.]
MCKKIKNDHLKFIQMEAQNKTVLTVQNIINAPIEKVWAYWTAPEHITKWCNASEDWHTPNATNDLRVGGKFSTRMEAKDGSMGFDFGGVYDVVNINEYIAYTLGDERKVNISFTADGNSTKVVENFEAENENPIEMQQGGWQAIMDNFKTYTETN